MLITFGIGISTINIVEWIYTTDYHTVAYAPGAFALTNYINISTNKIISFTMAFVISMSVYLFLKFHRLGVIRSADGRPHTVPRTAAPIPFPGRPQAEPGPRNRTARRRLDPG